MKVDAVAQFDEPSLNLPGRTAGNYENIIQNARSAGIGFSPRTPAWGEVGQDNLILRIYVIEQLMSIVWNRLLTTYLILVSYSWIWWWNNDNKRSPTLGRNFMIYSSFITVKIVACRRLRRYRQEVLHSFIQYSVGRQVQSLLQNDASI